MTLRIEGITLQNKFTIGEKEEIELERSINKTFSSIEKLLKENNMQCINEDIIDDLCILISHYEKTFFKIGMKIGIQMNNEKR